MIAVLLYIQIGFSGGIVEKQPASLDAFDRWTLTGIILLGAVLRLYLLLSSRGIIEANEALGVCRPS